MKYLLIILICFGPKCTFSQEFTLNELNEIFLGDSILQKKILSSRGFEEGPAGGRHPLLKGLKGWTKGDDQSISFFNTAIDPYIAPEGISMHYYYKDSRLFKTIHNTLIKEALPPEKVGGLFFYYDFNNNIIYACDTIPLSFEGRRMREYHLLFFKPNESYKKSNKIELYTQKIDINYAGVAFQAKKWWLIQHLNLIHKTPRHYAQFIHCYGINDGLKEFFGVKIEEDSLHITQDTLMNLITQQKKKLDKNNVGISIGEPYAVSYANSKGFALDYSKKGVYIRKMVLSLDNHIIWVDKMAYGRDLDTTFQDIDTSIKFDSKAWFKGNSPDPREILNNIE